MPHRPAATPRVLMIDNYDSFTYNIVQYLGELGAEVEVCRNDDIDLAQLDALWQQGAFNRLCISPGPCSPSEAGISVAAIAHCAHKLPILGVCLGHEAIGVAFGARVVRARHLMHGKTSRITHTQQGLFAGLPREFRVNRYHSLALQEDSLPPALLVSARADDGEIMAIAHRTLPIHGLQFHPESILTEHGHALLRHFLCAPGQASTADCTHKAQA